MESLQHIAYCASLKSLLDSEFTDDCFLSYYYNDFRKLMISVYVDEEPIEVVIWNRELHFKIPQKVLLASLTHLSKIIEKSKFSNSIYIKVHNCIITTQHSTQLLKLLQETQKRLSVELDFGVLTEEVAMNHADILLDVHEVVMINMFIADNE